MTTRTIAAVGCSAHVPSSLDFSSSSSGGAATTERGCDDPIRDDAMSDEVTDDDDDVMSCAWSAAVRRWMRTVDGVGDDGADESVVR